MLAFKTASIRGSRPRYSDSDFYWAMYIMSGPVRVGRKTICDEMGIGEGSVRSILKALEKSNLLNTYQTGSVLNKRGHELFDSIPILVVNIDAPPELPDEYAFTVIVKKGGSRVTNGMKERDAGIRAGGLGCTTLVYRDGHIFMPPDWDLDIQAPEYADYLKSLDIMGPEDAMIIGNADDKYSARTSALNAAFALLE